MIIWESKPFGMCPVQALGWINDRPFYFRSRYSISCIEISNQPNRKRHPKTIIDADDTTEHILKEYEHNEAGTIKYSEAEKLIILFAQKLSQN